MNRNHLAMFGVVAQEQNLSRAAEKLMIGQPAVSLQIAEFERAMNVKLLDRLPRGVRPTAAGRLLADYAKRIADLEAEAELALRQMLGLVRGRLVVGASLTIGSYLAPTLLADFRQRHPGIDVALDVANTDEVQHRVVAGQIEFGLTEGFVEDDRLAARVFAGDELVLIVGPSHPLAKRRSISLATLAEQELVLREVGSGTRAVVERALKSNGVTPRVAMSLGSTEAIKATVSRGIGVGVVSSLAVPAELASGALIRLRVSDLRLRREFHAITLPGRTLSPVSEAFLNLLAPERQRTF